MLKKGFTLAEVLITLSIIGVIASLTLPALMANTREQQAKTALKKGVNTLTQAANMNGAQFGVNFNTNANSTLDDKDSTASLAAIFNNQLSIDETKGSNGWVDGNASMNGVTYSAGDGNLAVFLQDGSSIIIQKTVSNDSLGQKIIYDTNGRKGPNTLANCNGSTVDVTTEHEANKTPNCDSQTQRKLSDRYSLLLRDGKVYPNGPAARYAFDN